MNKSLMPCLLFIILFSSSQLYGQDTNNQNVEKKRNSIGVFFGLVEASAYYERNIIQWNKSYSNFRLGTGFASSLNFEGYHINPCIVHVTGNKDNHFEVNAGLKYLISGSTQVGGKALFDLYIGYRYEKPAGKSFFRIGISTTTLLNVGGGYNF